MAEYIKREEAVAIIEEKQKELCPLGRYSRTMVYGSDRDRFDSWQEIINSIEDIPAAAVVEAKDGKWMPHILTSGRSYYYCSICKEMVDIPTRFMIQRFHYCPHCGAKMNYDFPYWLYTPKIQGGGSE